MASPRHGQAPWARRAGCRRVASRRTAPSRRREGVIRPKWRDVVLEDAPGGGQRVSRINYEICVLQALRERLRQEIAQTKAKLRAADAELKAL